MVVFSAAPANGLKSTLNVAIRTADRFTRDFATVEDAQNRYEEVENVPVTLYDSEKGETPMNVLPDVFFREPQVMVIRDLVNTETLELCLEEIDNERLIITSVRSRDAIDTLLRMLAMKIPPEQFASKVSVVIFQKLIRKLCPDCKEAYQPSPKLLQKLGLPKGKVKELYRVRSEPEEGEKHVPCTTCYDIGYAGRTAFFDILEITDDLRKAMVTDPKPETLRQAARKSGQKGLTFEGTLLVAKGVTSVEELMRVLKS
jgi:type II secretory ATPase GspE/PulE/Tfp pilus assembly ATPase PilB-like protein